MDFWDIYSAPEPIAMMDTPIAVAGEADGAVVGEADGAIKIIAILG